MICEGCGELCLENRYGRCSWFCFDTERATSEEQEQMLDDAPEAFAFYFHLEPGIEIKPTDGSGP